MRRMLTEARPTPDDVRFYHERLLRHDVYFRDPSTSELDRLQAFATSVLNAEAAYSTAVRNREDLLSGMAQQVRPYLPPAPGENPLLAPTEGQPDSLAWMEAQFEIAAASLLGGLTNNVALAAGTSGFDVAYPSSITSELRHTLQHGFENSSNWTAIREITRRHVAMVAKLARTLAATPEIGAAGSMLDHTVIVFMSDNGEQHHSTASDWPKLVIGGNRLGLKTDGRTILYPGIGESGNRQVSNFFNSLGHALRDPDFNTFGREGSGRIAEGPLSELYG